MSWFCSENVCSLELDAIETFQTSVPMRGPALPLYLWIRVSILFLSLKCWLIHSFYFQHKSDDRKLCIKLIRSILISSRMPGGCPSRRREFSAETHGKGEWLPGKSIHKINTRLNQVLRWMWLIREGGCKMGGCGSDTLELLAGVPKAALILHYPILACPWGHRRCEMQSYGALAPGCFWNMRYCVLPKAGYWLLLKISTEMAGLKKKKKKKHQTPEIFGFWIWLPVNIANGSWLVEALCTVLGPGPALGRGGSTALFSFLCGAMSIDFCIS